jgi:hypothetical protein
MKQLITLYIIFAVGISPLFAQDIEIKEISLGHNLSNDMFPLMNGSSLYFISNRRISLFTSYFNQNNQRLYHLFKSDMTPTGSFGKPSLFAPEIQSPFNNGPFWLSEDGNTIYFTKSKSLTLQNTKSNRYGDLLGIYYAHKENNTWSVPNEINLNGNEKASFGQPAVSPDGRIMVFVSDKKNGFGKSDLYISEYQNGSWGEPVNMGSTINTSGNEIAPYFHSSGKLFFASNGHGGQGGLDIYYTRNDGKNWTSPTPIENPINSPYDDYGIFLMTDESTGYFTSNRSSSDKIYSLHRLFPVFENTEPQEDDNFCYTFFENGPYRSDTLPFIYRWNFGDGTTAIGLESDHCFPGPGNYRVTLNVVDTLQNVELYSVANYELELAKKEQVYISCPDTIRINQPIHLNATKSHLVTINPSDFYWDFGDNEKARGETIVHIFRKKGVFTITCGTIDKQNPQLKLSSSKEIVVIE